MKNNSREIVFCTALAALVVSMMLVPVGFAAFGVEEGDWAKYRIEAQIPAGMGDMGEIEEMDWMKFEVQSVSDTTVTLEGTAHYKNGTEETGEMMDGIESGFIIEANLTAGDEVTAPFFWTGVPMEINGTASRKYAGASREVNYIRIEMEEAGSSMVFKVYWDKVTGVLCELSMSVSGIYTMSMSFKMTETNMWEAEPGADGGSLITQWWFWVIIAVIVIVVVGSAFLLLRGRKAAAPAPAPTEPAPTE